MEKYSCDEDVDFQRNVIERGPMEVASMFDGGESGVPKITTRKLDYKRPCCKVAVDRKYSVEPSRCVTYK